MSQLTGEGEAGEEKTATYNSSCKGASFAPTLCLSPLRFRTPMEGWNTLHMERRNTTVAV